jgi:hypothetical protein
MLACLRTLEEDSPSFMALLWVEQALTVAFPRPAELVDFLSSFMDRSPKVDRAQ